MKVCFKLKNDELRSSFSAVERLRDEQKNPYDARALDLVLDAAKEWAEYCADLDKKYSAALERNPEFEGL